MLILILKQSCENCTNTCILQDETAAQRQEVICPEANSIIEQDGLGRSLGPSTKVRVNFQPCLRKGSSWRDIPQATAEFTNGVNVEDLDPPMRSS